MEYKTKWESCSQEQERNELEHSLFKKQYDELTTQHGVLFTEMQGLQAALRTRMAKGMTYDMRIQKKDTQITSM